MKKKKVTQSQLRKLLIESLFNPQKPGPLEMITKQAQPLYYEGRAIEFIMEARLGNIEHYHDSLIKAVMLLTLSRAVRNLEVEDAK